VKWRASRTWASRVRWLVSGMVSLTGNELSRSPKGDCWASGRTDCAERLVGSLGDDAGVQVGQRTVDHRASGTGVAGKVVPSGLSAGSRKKLETLHRPKEEI
jgi:hypothetical protein